MKHLSSKIQNKARTRPTTTTSIQHITESPRVIRQEKKRGYLNQKRSKIISVHYLMIIYVENLRILQTQDSFITQKSDKAK